MTKPKILMEMEKIPGIESSVQDINSSLNDIVQLKPSGLTDGTDTININNAISNLLVNGGTLELGKGTFYINSTISFNGTNQNKIIIKGRGWGSTRLVWNGILDGVIISTGTNSLNTAPVTIKDLTIGSIDDAHRASIGIKLLSKGLSEVSGCYFDNLKDGIYGSFILLSTIEKNYFAKITQDAVHFVGDVDQNNAITIRKNEFYWNGRYAINFDDSLGRPGSNSNVIEDNDFEGTVASTIASIHLADFTRGHIFNNRFEDGLQGGYPNICSIIFEGSQSNIVMANRFGEVNQDKNYWIILKNSSGGTDSSENRFISNTYANHGKISDIYANDYSTYNVSIGENSTVTGAYTWQFTFIGNKSVLLDGSSLKLLKAGQKGNDTGADIIHLNSKQIANLNAIPTTGTWKAGDFIFNRTYPDGVNSPFLGWICTVAGTPGTWKPIPGTVGDWQNYGSAPKYIGQLCVNAGIGYMATGTSSTADWKQITN